MLADQNRCDDHAFAAAAHGSMGVSSEI